MQEAEYKLASGIRYLLTAYFFVSTIVVISSCVSQFMNCVTIHGKLHKKSPALVNVRSTTLNNKLACPILGLNVSKGLFCYFYIVGMLMTMVCIHLSYPSCNRLFIFLLHVIRRLYEEIFISQHNTEYSKMNVFVFLFGLSYYVIMPITVMTTRDFNGKIAGFQCLFFASFSLVQNRSHVTLSNIKSKNSGKYGIPYGGLFKFISCPHYFSEIGIYLSLFIDDIFYSNNLHIKVALIYIICCMFVNAIRTHRWYIDHYKETYLSLNRKAIFPFVM